jgi:hypothetical protein
MLFLLPLLVGSTIALGLPSMRNPFEDTLKSKRAEQLTSTEVDLGYAVYQGVQNTTSNLTVFKG